MRDVWATQNLSLVRFAVCKKPVRWCTSVVLLRGGWSPALGCKEHWLFQLLCNAGSSKESLTVPEKEDCLHVWIKIIMLALTTLWRQGCEWLLCVSYASYVVRRGVVHGCLILLISRARREGESAWRFLLSVMTMWSLHLTAFKHTPGMNIKVLCIEHILTNLGWVYKQKNMMQYKYKIVMVPESILTRLLALEIL